MIFYFISVFSAQYTNDNLFSGRNTSLESTLDSAATTEILDTPTFTHSAPFAKQQSQRKNNIFSGIGLGSRQERRNVKEYNPISKYNTGNGTDWVDTYQTRMQILSNRNLHSPGHAQNSDYSSMEEKMSQDRSYLYQTKRDWVDDVMKKYDDRKQNQASMMSNETPNRLQHSNAFERTPQLVAQPQAMNRNIPTPIGQLPFSPFSNVIMVQNIPHQPIEYHQFPVKRNEYH